MPPLVKVGVWEQNEFIGCVLFSRGANNNLGRPYGLAVTQVAELTRVALREHQTPVTRIVAIALRMLKGQSDGLRLVVSFADPNEGHVGAIYQAGNWLYLGMTPPKTEFINKQGKRLHTRQVSADGLGWQFGKRTSVAKRSECEPIALLGKYRYVLPLDADMRARITPLAKPYPKKPRATSITADASPVQGEEGGSTPTVALP